ncbi:MAG: hypothetical protein WBV94_04035 [Blastocatellia bacterium]
MIQAATQLKPKDAIAFLRSRILTPQTALQNLSAIESLWRMLALFTHYFPKELEQYKHLSVLDEDQRRKLIHAFYDLVERDLFPLSDWTRDAEDAVFDSMIQTDMLNSDWWDCDFDHLIELTQAILIGSGSYDTTKHLFHVWPGSIDYAKLEGLVKDLGEPVCWLGDAVRIVGHETGYDWLDADMEMMGNCVDTWCVTTVDAIASVYLEIKVILDRFYTMQRWMKEGGKAERERRFRFVKNTVAACLPGGKGSTRTESTPTYRNLVVGDGLAAVRSARRRPARKASSKGGGQAGAGKPLIEVFSDLYDEED